MNRKDRELLQHILEAIDNVQMHVADSASTFTRQRAVVFELITIGEALAHVSDALKHGYPEIPWRLIADARNRMVHNYEDISSKIVWDIVEHHLSPLSLQIQHILKSNAL